MLYHRSFHTLALLGVTTLLIGTGDASARKCRRGCRAGVGVGVGAYPYYGGGYQGFYSNGFSKYGPPVPTYGPVAGTFGGSDQRYGPGLPSMFYPVQVPLGKQYPPQAHLTAAPKPQPAASNDTIVLDIILPSARAEVDINGQTTDQTGTRRTFQSPPVAAGKVYQYEVEAWWNEDGRDIMQRRFVRVQAGGHFVVDFTKLEPVSRP